MKQYFEIKSPHFRHAAFRALDKSLITIEVYGTPEDVQALKTWRTEVTDFAVKDRIEFTLTELEYRLEQDIAFPVTTPNPLLK
jgi:hypothetical protein